ncbi:hypothetical protein N9D59_04815 [Burkholderiaceae bacterium]|nr:hypothetical protein [Burkholderiaceae bacterium]
MKLIVDKLGVYADTNSITGQSIGFNLLMVKEAGDAALDLTSYSIDLALTGLTGVTDSGSMQFVGGGSSLAGLYDPSHVAIPESGAVSGNQPTPDTLSVGWFATGSKVILAEGDEYVVGTVTYPATQEQIDALGSIGVSAAFTEYATDADTFTDGGGSNVTVDVPELFAPPTATLTWKPMSDEAPTPTDLDGDGAIDLNMMSGALEVTVAFSKPVTGFSSSNVEMPGFMSMGGMVDQGGDVYKFTIMASGSDQFSGSVGLTGMSSVVDGYGNAFAAFPAPLLFDGDTQAPDSTISGDFTWYSGQVPDGTFAVNTANLQNDTAFRLYARDGDAQSTGGDGSFVGQSTFADGSQKTLQIFDLPAYESGMTQIYYTVVDKAGNESTDSTSYATYNYDGEADDGAPYLVGIKEVDIDPRDGVTDPDEAYFVVEFSEIVHSDLMGSLIDNFSVSGLSAGYSGTISAGELEALPGSQNEYGSDRYYVAISGLGAEDDPIVQLKGNREVVSFELSTASPSASVVGDGGETLWATVRLDADFVMDGDAPYFNVSYYDLDAQFGETVNAYLGGFQYEGVDANDASVLYFATSGTTFTTRDGSNETQAPITTAQDVLWTDSYFQGPGQQFYSSDDSHERVIVDPDPGLNDFYALLGTEGAGFVITPETGERGLDTIDLSALNGSVVISSESGEVIYTAAGQSTVTTVYDTSGFEGYVLTNNGVNDFIGSQLSEIVYVGDGGDNVLRAGNRASGDEAPETDTVSYAATDTAINVNLGTNASKDVTVIRGANDADNVDGDVVDDVISGFEGVIGSTGNDTITGSGIGNFLAGAGGDDIIYGQAGDDILYGGDGADELYGGSGSDMLIDLDGSVLQGSDSVGRNPTDATEQDIFVVREGATIKNFHLSGDGTGLAGRSTSANDAIIFSISAAAFAGKGLDLTAFFDGGDPSNELLDGAGFFSYVKDHLVFNTPQDDGAGGQNLVVQFKDGATVFEVGNVKLDGLTEMLAGAEGEQSYSAGVVQLDWLTEAFNTNQQGFNSKIDMQAVNEASGLGDSGLNFAVALEAVRAGTVRGADVNGVMAGDMSLAERIYNPGFGDERIIGGKTSDRYEFLVQTFEDSNGAPSGAAGNDAVLDIGGYDVLSFSDVALNQLVFEAVKVGREAGENSLRVSYEQTDSSGTVNDGEIIWQGHFSEGGRLAAEALEVGSGSGATVYALAAARYEYDADGYVVGGAKITSDANYGDVEAAFDVAADVIMVGQYGSGEDADTFVFETGGDAALSDGTQEAHIWNFNDGDIIDVTDYVREFGEASAVANWTSNTSSGANTLESYSADIVFGANTSTELALSLTFYGSGLVQTDLEDSLLVIGAPT